MNHAGKIQLLTLKAISNIQSPSILCRLRFYEIIYEMLTKSIVRNKREIYYLDVKIFKTQRVVDNLINSTCKILSLTPFSLNITNTLKGIFYGSVTFHFVSTEEMRMNNTTSLIPDMNRVRQVTTSSTLCVVVEKDTIFSKIIRESKDLDWLLVCGKGYPCRNTLLFLSKLSNIRIVGLFDYDPYGLDIFLNYRRICSIEKIGLSSEDLRNVKHSIDLNTRDINRMKALKDRSETAQEAKEMQIGGVKAELENLFESECIVKYITRKINK